MCSKFRIYSFILLNIEEGTSHGNVLILINSLSSFVLSFACFRMFFFCEIYSQNNFEILELS